jgi:metal-responsive CopG/Arc/MetJ family transcriptional regulator
METITIKLESSLSQAMEKVMKKHYYSTKTEFVREALRDKIQILEKEEKLTSKKSTSREDILKDLEDAHHIF